MEASHLSNVNIAENKNTSKSVISSYVNFAGTFTLRFTKNRLGFTTSHRKLTKNTEYNFLAQLPLVLNQETWQLHGQLPPRKANEERHACCCYVSGKQLNFQPHLDG